jgi:hypothetical protein
MPVGNQVQVPQFGDGIVLEWITGEVVRIDFGAENVRTLHVAKATITLQTPETGSDVSQGGPAM